MSLIALNAIGVQYGATHVLRDVTFTIGARDRWGVVGRNGAGKTSLFRLLTGEQAPSTGQVSRAPGLRVSMLDQHREFPGATTVWGAVADAFREVIDLEIDLARQEEWMSSSNGATEAQLARYSRDLSRFEDLGGYRYASLVDQVLDGLGFTALRARTQALSSLSGGERGRVALARQLVVPSDVLLFDEPTNHLDLETTRWLEDHLGDSPATQVIVSHDRAFLEGVIDHVLHIENLGAVAYSGTYSEFVRQRSERRLSRQRAFDRQQQAISREAEYIARNIAGQNARQAKGRRKRLDRLPRLSQPAGDEASMTIRFEPGDRGGDQVVACERLAIGAGGRTLLSGFTGWIRRGDVVGLIGPNGAGKSTLLRTIAGAIRPEGGEALLGGATKVAMYSQDLAEVPRDKSILDVISDLRPAWDRGRVMGHLGRMRFTGDEVQRLAGSLSGGELARVALAVMMLSRANLMLFDEPTNHLDVESIEELEDAIEGFEGTVILVSHDRVLLSRLVTRVWELRDGALGTFDGTFDEWQSRQADEKAAPPAGRQAVSSGRQRGRASRVSKALAGSFARRRTLREAVERAERRIAMLEERERELVVALADAALYQAPRGHDRAQTLGEELRQVRTVLTEALSDWEGAARELEPEDGSNHT